MIDKPNMVIVKFDDTLVGFPLSEDGIISEGEAFDSDYDLEEHNLIFAAFDESSETSKELHRFSFLNNDGKEERVKLLYEQDELLEFVKHIVEHQLGDK